MASRIRKVVDPSYWRLRHGPLWLRRIFVGRWTAEEIAAIKQRAHERHLEVMENFH